MKSNLLLRSVVDRVSRRISGGSIPEWASANIVRPRALAMETLEPRVLFSGAPAPDAAPEPPAEPAPAAHEVPAAADESTSADSAETEATVATPPAPEETEGSSGDAASQDATTPAGSQGFTSIYLSSDELSAVAQAAAQRWNASGLGAEQSAALANVTYQIADLSEIGGNILALTDGYSITIDDDAAGRGWFVDQTPDDDAEFELTDSGLSSLTTTGIDLLSVLLHEQGHVLGLDGSGRFSDVMNGVFIEGERRLPVSGQADGAVAGSLEGLHFATWNLNNTGSWNDNANWITPPTYPNAVDAEADLSQLNITSNRTINVNEAITIGSLLLGDSSGTQTYTLAPGTAGTLTFDVASGNATITKTSGGTDLITAPVTISDGLVITVNTGQLNITGGLNNGGNLLTVTGSGNTSFAGTANIITGSGGLTKTGSGTLFLGAGGTTPAHNYTGPTTVNGGIVMLFNNKAAGNFTLNNGMLTDYYRATTIFSAGLGAGNNQIQIFGDSGFGGGNGNSNWRIGAQNSVLKWGTTYFNPTSLKFLTTADNRGPSIYGTVTLQNGLDLNGAARTIDVLGNVANDPSRSTATVGAITDTAVGGGGSLIKTGAGRLILNTASTFAGGVTISAGSVQVGNATGLGNGGPLAFNGSGTTLDLRADTTVSALSGTGTNIHITAGAAGARTLTVNQSTDTTFGGVIENGLGSVSVVKSGGGALTLTGNNTYTGATAVNAGTLLVNGATAASAVTVASGATLGGTGTLGGTVTVNTGGTLAAGSGGIGTLNLSASPILNGTVFAEINKSGVTLSADKINVGAALAFGGTLTVTASGDTLAAGDIFDLFDATSFSGSFATVNLPTAPSGTAWDTSQLLVDGTIKLLSTGSLSAGLDGSNNLVITDTDGTGKNNQFTISNDGSGNIVITDAAEQFGSTGGIAGASLSNGNKTLTVPLASIGGTNIIVNAALGDDTLTASLANSLGKTLDFNGGTGGFDSLALSGGTTTSQTFNFTNENDGSVVLAGALAGTINYTGLEPITSTINATDVTLNYSAVAETITVTNPGGGQTTVDSTAGEVVTFNNPTATLTINAGDGNDIINLNGLAAAYPAAITIDGQGGTDTVHFGGIISLNGALAVTAESVSQSAALSVAGTATFTNANATLTNAANNFATVQITNGGTVSLTDANALVLAASSFTGALTLNSSGAITQTGILSGGGSLVKNGSGTMALNLANSYGGGTTLNAGTVAISNATSFGTGNVSVAGSSRIDATGGVIYANAINVGAALSMQYKGASNGTATFSGVLSGSNPITVVSSGLGGNNRGTLDFTNTNNTFTGNVILPSATGGSDYFSFASIGDGGNLTVSRASWREGFIYTGSSNITFNTRQIAIASTAGGATGLDGNGIPIDMFQNNGTGTVTFNTAMSVPGSIASSGFFFFGGTNTGDNTFAGTIANPGGANTLGIGKWDVGKWILTGANSYLGRTWIANGTLSVNAIATAATDQPLGRGSLIQLGNQGTSGTLEFTGSTNSTTDKQVQLGNASATQTGAGSILNNGTGALIFSAANFNPAIAGITATRTLTLGGTNTDANTIQGTIQNNSATGLVALTKTGTGTWVLSGANTYTGNTIVNAGTLQFATRESLYNNTAANWTAAKINVKNGATLALNVDSAGTAGFTSANLNTLLTNISVAGSATAGLQSGATLGFDTGTASGGTFTQGNAIANSTGANGGTIGVAKLGTGTLVLDKANTYTGATTVDAGTLLINGSATSAVNVNNTGSFGGAGTVGGNVTVASDAHLAPGAASGTAGTLSITGGLNISGMAGGAGTLKFDLDALASTNDRINVIGGATIGTGLLGFSDFDFTNLGGLEAGTYTLISTTTGFGGGTLDAADLTGSFGSLNGELKISGNNLVLDVISPLDAVDDDYTTTSPTDEDTVLIITGPGVLGNDTPSSATIIAFDATSASGATVTVNPDGSFSYDPTGSGTLQALNEGDILTDTFTYTITDGVGVGASPLDWNFSNDSLNGWTVLNGVANFSGDGVSASQSNGNFAHDGAHETFLVESPDFRFDGSTLDGTNALIIDFDGGQGNQSGSVATFANPGEALAFNSGNSASNGLKAVALYNTLTGQYDATLFDPGNAGGIQTAVLAASAVSTDVTYRLHFYENDEGSWGWTRMNRAQIAGGEPVFGATDTATVTVTINGLNDAPTFVGAVNNFGGVSIGDFTSDGDLVSDLLNKAVSDVTADVDNGALPRGIAVTGETGSGRFQYSTDGGGSWTDVNAVANSALILSENARVRYVPDGVSFSDGTLTYRAWDQFTNAEGDRVDLSAPSSVGGTTAFSAAEMTSTVSVYNVVIDNGKIIYTAAAGQTNDIRVSMVGGELRIWDVNGHAVSTGLPDSDGRGNGIGIAYNGEDLVIETKSEADFIRFSAMDGFTGSITADGGEGFDVIETNGTHVVLGEEKNVDFAAEKILFNLDSSISVTGAGTINIAATGGGAEDFVGIQLRRSGLSSAGGAITLVGEGGSVGSHNGGVQLTHGSSITTTGGSVSITGTATNTSGPNDGVSLVGGSDITVGGAGTITITGTSSGASDSYGVQLFTGTELTSAEGDITVSGRGTGTGARNSGLYSTGATVTTTGAGSISLDGGGSGTGSHGKGLRLTATTITATGSGDITLTGTGGAGTSSNVGVEVGVRTSVSTASGDVTITGEGAGSTTLNTGVAFLSKSSVSAGGNITVTGTAGNGTSQNEGVSLVSATLSAAGNLAVSGLGKGSGSYNPGVDSAGSTLSGGGNVSLTGTGSANGGGRFNDGVNLKTTTATGNTVSITGNGGTGTHDNRGVSIFGSTVTGATSLAISGTSAGTTGVRNHGVSISNTTLSDDGTITGTAAAGTPNFGVYMQNITGGAGLDVSSGPDDDDEEKGGNYFNVLPALFLAAGADKAARRRKAELLTGLIGRLGTGETTGKEVSVYREEDGHVGLEAAAVTLEALAAAGVEVPEVPEGGRRVLLLTGGDLDPASGFFAVLGAGGELVGTSGLDGADRRAVGRMLERSASEDAVWSDRPSRGIYAGVGGKWGEAFGLEE